LIDAANKKWDKKKRELRTAVEATRGTEASELIFAKLGKLDPSDRKGKVAMLRMLAGCGTKEHAQRLRGYLDDDDNSIRVAAINALRGMVDGELPLEDISAFEAIETAKKWKSKL
jgi:hypothetical protein